MAIITVPPLNNWLANLAGILPLSALIKFTEPPVTLHSYQLSGRGLLWNWLITPAGARLLLSSSNQTTSCCLDCPGATLKLYCIDGRWGDCYPCSSPFTVRTCISGAPTSKHLTYTNPDIDGLRRQRLEIVRMSTHDEPTKKHTTRGSFFQNLIDQHDRKWIMILAIGWVVWAGVLSTCFMTAQYIAAVYIVVLPLTGLTVRYSHGHGARRLLDSAPSEFSRLVVLCDSMNGSEWTAFIGGHRAVDSLLNKPLYQVKPTGRSALLRAVLRILLATQWGLTAAACAFQDWNAVIVFAWIAICMLVSTYVYSDHSAVQDWLKTNNIRLEKAQLNFTSRRAMLSTLMALNPDRKNTKWIDPILAVSDDRRSWEEALQEHLENGKCLDPDKAPYWWKFLTQGVDIAKTVEPWVKAG